ncbi:hypothetical protein A2W14_01665 [Candidatus Gottesmanbacteria bacterium RBG_16_37_8]|uniref:Tryptophan synthase beta chain-like PALP domain-containing protein n=1 Tax=Candidatus Gottesmanbacteria bacterium RBG_16_37_8 TaxID=1798371 RepID=A0A1F5YR65_9BACT|nr:MAG: hypothetical protein A2W14_01665 [Candidatus Gottesmanbacteria bacterium RBG_16_37_8]
MKQENQGIWKYWKLLPFVSEKYRLSQGEGSTGLKRYDGIYFKCEFENPTGSVKDRGICFQVAKLSENGQKKAVISSSGNAAISAASYCNLQGITLKVYVSPKINPHKLAKIASLSLVSKTNKPLSQAFRYSLQYKAANLRQSTDPHGWVGYSTISFELKEELPLIDALFLPVSSGTTLLGIFNGFAELNNLPAIHAVQSAFLNPLSSQFDKKFIPEKNNLCDAIVAKYLPLEKKIIDIIKKTKGFSWTVENSQIRKKGEQLKKYNLNVSNEGAACLAAVYKAAACGYVYKNPVCLLTGMSYS